MKKFRQLIISASVIFSLVFSLTSFAQNKITISGTATDSATGETLIGASVSFKEIAHSGTVTNAYGFYSLLAKQGQYTLIVSYAGYETISRQVIPGNTLHIDFSLQS